MGLLYLNTLAVDMGGNSGMSSYFGVGFVATILVTDLLYKKGWADENAATRLVIIDMTKSVAYLNPTRRERHCIPRYRHPRAKRVLLATFSM
jgi:hypothetical protein